MKKFAIVLALMCSLYLPSYASTDQELAVDLVDKAVDTFQAKGKDYALKLIGASAGPLRKGSLYVYAVNFKGQFVAHPVQEDLRGHDGWELQDAKGKFIIQDLIKEAKDKGQGWYEYSWIRVNETSPTLKKVYFKRVPGEEVLVAAGFYVVK
jgi:cytochrome c